MMVYKKITPLLMIGAVLAVVTILSLFGARFIENSSNAQAFIAELGYPGIILIAIVGGLNFIVPIPAVTLTPVFTAAGLWLPGIILSLTVGTLIADLLGFQFGNWSRSHIYKNYPRVISYLEKIHTNRPYLIVPVIFLYAAFLPFPNEVLVIPLALLNVRLRLIIAPLFLGNLAHQTAYAIGMQGIFNWMF